MKCPNRVSYISLILTLFVFSSEIHILHKFLILYRFNYIFFSIYKMRISIASY